MPPRRSTGSSPKTKMTINWRVPNGNSSNDEYEKLDEEVIKRASEGSMLDLILLATNVKFVPSTHRKDAFSLFLAFLRDTETMFDGCEPMQAVLAGILLKVLLGVGQSSLWVEYGKSMAQELAENWKTVTRWVCRFCDKFNSVTEPFPGAPISYADWYCSLASALFIAHAEPNRAREFWSVPDARKGLFRLWLLDGPDLPSHVVKMCASVVGIVILHQYCDNMDPASELVKVSGLDEDGVAHLCMTRMIKAAKRGNVDDIRDNAYVVFALVSTRSDALRFAMLKKKAIPFLTQTFVKLANVNTIHEDTKNIDFVDKLLRVFEYVLQPDGGVPYLLQALRNGFLQGVVNCGPLLSLLRPDAVNALKHIIDHFLISYLSYYSVLIAIIDALKDVDRKCLEQNVDQSALKPSWMKFEQYVLERSVCKALFERCIQSDTSVSSCAQCGKRDVKNNFQKCGGCRIMHYCSKDCQTTHWKEGGHRAICKRILETGGGWDRRDRRFSEFITVYDISRHAADLHQMALKKYGVQPVPLGKTLPYGSSVDYGTVPPTFDVFKLEDDVGENETSYLNSKKDDWDEGVKTRGSGGFLAKFILPRGASDLGQMFLADTGLIGMHLWQRNSDDLTLAFGPRFRWTGIDSDGKSLGAVSDEIDGVLNKLPLAKVRMGDHFLWSSYMGRMSVLEAISELADIEKKIYGI